jgi:methionine aminopeptidase
MPIIIKNAEDIAKMRVAGRLASEVLDYITPYVQPGVTTEELDRLCHDYMVNQQGCIPAPLNYAPEGHAPYPKSICTSVNQVICHGVPNDKALKKGDIVNLDITVIKDGYHVTGARNSRANCARTGASNQGPKARKSRAAEVCLPGQCAQCRDISAHQQRRFSYSCQ